MSAGTSDSDSGGSGDDNSDDDDDDASSQVSVATRLIDAIEIDATDSSPGNDFAKLWKILWPKDDGRRHCVIMDEDIERALWRAANYNRIEACRLLWAKLGANAKKKYLSDTVDARLDLLHIAVRNNTLKTHDSVEIVRLCIEEFHFNADQVCHSATPLFWAIYSERMRRYLLQGANRTNQGFGRLGSPINDAVSSSNRSTEVVSNTVATRSQPEFQTQIIARGVLQSATSSSHYGHLPFKNGDIEILSLLLQYNALMDEFNSNGSLNRLLHNPYKERNVKLSIARVLAEDAKKAAAPAAFFFATDSGEDCNQAKKS